MTCKYSAQLSKFIDNELDARNKEIMIKHISTCPSCNRELSIVQTLKKSLINNKINSNPEFFWQQLKDRIKSEEIEAKKESFAVDFGVWSRKLIPVPVAIGIIAALFFSVTSIAKEDLLDRYLFGNNNSSQFISSEEDSVFAEIGV